MRKIKKGKNMGFKITCEGCGDTVFGITSSLTKVQGRYLCNNCSSNRSGRVKYYCNACHNTTAIALKRGNGWIEALLYLMYIAPGVIYSVWRRSGKPNVCPLCKAASLIPADMAKPLPIATSALRDEVDCPHCAEPILARANVCKHCGGVVRVQPSGT